MKRPALIDYGDKAAATHPSDDGTIHVGPLRLMGREAILSIMDKHRITTGFDIGIRLTCLGGGLMNLTIRGREIAGYFLEKNSFGVEASEEDVEAFLLETTVPGTVVSVIGTSVSDAGVTIVSRSSHIRSDKAITTSAIRHRRKGDEEIPIMVISAAPRGRFEKALRKGASHLHLIPKVEMA